jgi:osmoprotectant transport system permease protein
MNLARLLWTHREDIAVLTAEHLWLVGWAMALALLVGLPLGIWIAHRPQWRRPVLGAANVLETIPSLALLGFLLSVPWIQQRADRQAITALMLYALLPIIQNTAAAIAGIEPGVREAAVAMGMTPGQILRRVELPLGLPVILGGIRVAAVLTIGIATVAPAIGAGGLGELIFRGIAMVDNGLILAGAIPAAALALLADFLLGWLERRLMHQR